MINNKTELLAATTYLTAAINEMCNTSDIEVVSSKFCEAKDNLIEIFKYNVTRLQK